MRVSPSQVQDVLRARVRERCVAAEAEPERPLESCFEHHFHGRNQSLLTGLGHLAHLARSPSRLRRGSPTCPEGASPLLQKIFDACAPSVSRGTVPDPVFATSGNAASPEVLLTGPEIFPRMAEKIAGAKREITFQALNWQEGADAAREILHGLRDLEQRQRERGATRPVVVRIVVNEGIVKELRSYKQMVRQLKALQLDPRLVQLETSCHRSKLNGLLHSKTLIIDGTHAIITGANPETCHNADRRFYDAAYELEGPVVEGLRGDFEDIWWRCTGKRIPPSLMIPLTVAGPGVPMLITSRKSDGFLPRHRTDNTASQAFLALARNVHHSIRLQTPNLNAGPLVKELIAAAERGCEVEIVLSRGFNDRHEAMPLQGGTNEQVVEQMYRTLEAHGVPGAVERLKVRWYSHDGETEVQGDGDHASHAKFMTGDDEVAIVGSSNGDTQSWSHSRELNVVVGDAATTRAWIGQFFAPSFARGIPAWPLTSGR